MKTILSIVMLIFALFISSESEASLIIQDSSDSIDLSSYFENLAALSGAILVLVELIKQSLEVKGHVLRYISWGVGLALAFAAWKFKLGMFEHFSELWMSLSTGFAAALIANGTASVKLLRAILNLIGLKTAN